MIHTTAARKFSSRSSSEKPTFPKGRCTIPVLSVRYSTLPFLNSSIACRKEKISVLIGLTV